jgi:hypothetical protein
MAGRNVENGFGDMPYIQSWFDTAWVTAPGTPWNPRMPWGPWGLVAPLSRKAMRFPGDLANRGAEGLCRPELFRFTGIGYYGST